MILLNMCEAVSLEDRIQYLTLLCQMASVDGRVSPDELKFLKDKLKEFEIPPSMESEICDCKNYNIKVSSLSLKDLNKKGLEYSFFMDLIAMAMVDGVVMESERKLLSGVLNQTDISLEEYHNMINFAQAVIFTSADYPVDPMYLSVIEMQFQWLNQRAVKLFWQTTFAFSTTIDTKLKHQLVNYNLPG